MYGKFYRGGSLGGSFTNDVNEKIGVFSILDIVTPKSLVLTVTQAPDIFNPKYWTSFVNDPKGAIHCRSFRNLICINLT